jgi:hypothetical protein
VDRAYLAVREVKLEVSEALTPNPSPKKGEGRQNP